MSRFARVTVLCFGMFAAWGPAHAHAGHGVVHIPSFYPHEITIETIDPASAAAEFKKNTLHVYVGSEPHFGGSVPGHLRPAESLEAFLILGFNPASKAVKRREERCAVARGIVAALEGQSEDVILNPYPVTPFHPDYLQHLDRLTEAKAKVQAQGVVNLDLKFRAKGERAQALAQSRWQLDRDNWDVSLEEVPVDGLMSNAGGRLGPPWMKEGWFHAYQLLASAIDEPQQKWIARMFHRRLTQGQYQDVTERFDLQRRLVASLRRTCNRMVVGYTLRREYYDDSFSGVENIAVDSQLGLNSPVLIRTIKLKDFPWNGSLRLGIKEKPEAAWNPVAGFTDPPGRLIWSSLGDPALLPLPYNSSWIPNRVEPLVEGKPGARGFQVPRDAFIPQPGTGALLAVGEGKKSTASIIYRVTASAFHDGLETEVADLLYPYALAYRWGAKASDNDSAYDPAIDAATALMRQQLVAVRVLRVEQKINELGPDIKVPQKTPVVEVYTNYLAPDSRQMADLAPPWSSVPWQVLVLMEEAAKRGFAAFSKDEAERRGIPWLDLARDAALQEKLKALNEEFQREGYRPDALKGLVDSRSARVRWAALRKFADEHGHFLVTNGPYRFTKWSENSAVLGVVRELTYPHAVGSFNHYAYPPRAIITEVKREANRVLVYADVEKVVHEQRSYRTVRERLKRGAMRGLYLIRPDSRYLVLGPDGSVVQASSARFQEDGHFVAELPERLPRGRYTFVVAVYLDGNAISPAARILSFEATGS
ncbi:MAG: hypothetical protein ACE5LB_01665 [Acidiferrobacterales bacterium]